MARWVLKMSLRDFFNIRSFHDLNRLFRLQTFLSLELAKGYMMVNCGCEVNELNNWVSHAIRTPWYWRIASDGTRFVAGPYSSLWYWLNFPAHYGYWIWMSYLLAIDIGITGFSFWTRPWKLLVPYMMGSIYFFNVDPIDIFIFFISILPILVRHWWTLMGPITAVLIKLPIDAPSYVWSFILHNPYGIHEPGGWFRYAQIGAWWLAGIAFYVYHRKKTATGKGSESIV